MTTVRIRSKQGGEAVEIRHVRTHEEFVACVELQVATWGADFRETVPATMLKISQRLGGVTAGAFAEDGTLLGFVFGMTGVERGAIVHWSDMLAVRTGMQDHGIGRRLKEFQRDAVHALGVTRMYWTYDPLVARNAHLNLNRLGARVAEYVPDMYGSDTGSVMHTGFGTDRFIVVWPIGRAEPGLPAVRPVVTPSVRGPRGAPVVNAGTGDGREIDFAPFSEVLPPTVRVEIPADIFSVLAKSAARAKHWRATTRLAFQWALANGYAVQHFESDAAAASGFYVLARTPSAEAPARARDDSV